MDYLHQHQFTTSYAIGNNMKSIVITLVTVLLPSFLFAVDFQGNGPRGDGTGITTGDAQNAAGFADDGTTVRLDDVGDSVGIGTATPLNKLDVNGAIRSTGTIITGLLSCDTLDTDSGGRLFCGTDDAGSAAGIASYIATATLNMGNNNITNAQTIFSTASVPTVLCLDGDCKSAWPAAAGGDNLGNHVPTQTITTAFGIASSSGAYFTGSIGIATTAPSNQLHIVQSGAASDGIRLSRTTAVLEFLTDTANGYLTMQSAHPLKLGTSGNTHFTIDSAGQVGVGTTSPGSKLDVAGGNIRLDDNANLEWGSSNNVISGNDASGFVRIITGGSERLRVISGGNVGIGSTAPGSKLEVLDGDISIRTDGKQIRWGDGTVWIDANSATDFISFNTTSLERIRIAQQGFVGIGTNAPNYNLHTVGTALVTSSMTVNGGLALSSGTLINSMFADATVFDVPSVAAASTFNQMIPSTGTAIGDHCFVNAPALEANLSVSISSAQADNINLRFTNPSVGSVDPGVQTYLWFCIRR